MSSNRDSTRLWDQVQAHLPVGAQVLDRNGLTESVNDTFLEMFGYPSRIEVEGVLNSLNPAVEDESGMRPYIRRAFAGEVVEVPVVPHHSAPGNAPTLCATLIPVFAEDGALDHVIVLYREIEPDRPQMGSPDADETVPDGLAACCAKIARAQSAESVVEGALECTRTVLQDGAAAVWEQDAGGAWTCAGSAGLPETAAASLKSALDSGVCREWDYGAGAAKFIVGATDPHLAEHAAIVRAAGWGWGVLVPMDRDGAVSGLLARYRKRPPANGDAHADAATLVAAVAGGALRNARLIDQLTAAKDQLEEQLEAGTEELKTAHANALANERLAAVGFLAKEVAHGLRNPLNVVSASTYYLKLRFPKGDEKIEKHFDNITRAVTQAANIITNLVSLSGGNTLTIAEVDVNDLAQCAVHEQGLSRRAAVDLQLDPDVPRVMGDWSQLLQAVRALLNNPATSLRKAPAILRTEHDGDSVFLSIGDDRKSISPEEAEAAFGTFTVSATEWTGLSLSVARQIAVRHGGNVTVEETDGLTWFRLRLPLKPAS